MCTYDIKVIDSYTAAFVVERLLLLATLSLMSHHPCACEAVIVTDENRCDRKAALLLCEQKLDSYKRLKLATYFCLTHGVEDLQAYQHVEQLGCTIQQAGDAFMHNKKIYLPEFLCSHSMSNAHVAKCCKMQQTV